MIHGLQPLTRGSQWPADEHGVVACQRTSKTNHEIGSWKYQLIWAHCGTAKKNRFISKSISNYSWAIMYYYYSTPTTSHSAVWRTKGLFFGEEDERPTMMKGCRPRNRWCGGRNVLNDRQDEYFLPRCISNVSNYSCWHQREVLPAFLQGTFRVQVISCER